MSTGWPRDRAGALLAALDEMSLSIPRPVAEQLIRDRVSEVAAAMGISPATARGHLTDEVIAGIAQDLAASLAEERPGVDLYEAARTAAISVENLGRTIAGLAEATLVGLAAAEDLDQARHRIGELAHCLSTLGTIAAAGPADRAEQAAIALPPGLLHRAARQLDNAAASAEQGSAPANYRGDAGALAQAFRRDANRLRALATEGSATDHGKEPSPLRLV